MSRFLKYLKKGRQVLKNWRAFDIETDGLGGEFIAVGWITESGEVEISDDWLGFVEDVMLDPVNQGVLWTAHNMGRYEALYLLDKSTLTYLAQHGYTVEIIGPRNQPCLLQITKDDMKWSVWDSYSLIRQSLAKATETFNTTYKKQKGAIDFDTDTWTITNSIHRDYLRYDCLSLQELVATFRDYFIQVFGVEPSYTLPSSAVKAWRHTISDDRVYFAISRDSEEVIRKAYRGGRVLLTDSKIHGEVDKYDFNSMYPSVMREHGVPTGPARFSRKLKDKPGFVKVKVEVPDDAKVWECVLTDETGIYPRGIFWTYASTLELDYARANGTKVLGFAYGYYFDQTESVFTSFVNRVESERQRAASSNDGATGSIVKLTQNSLYGKFAQRRDQVNLVVSEESQGVPHSDIHGDLIEYVYEVPSESKASCIMPHWAAWITSAARVKLLREVAAYGKRFIYGDTDSLFIRRASESAAFSQSDNGIGRGPGTDSGLSDFTRFGDRYGELKNEGRFYQFFVIAPKTYSTFTVEGKHVAAVKGIPNRLVTREVMVNARQNCDSAIKFFAMRSVASAVGENDRGYNTHRTVPKPTSTSKYKWDGTYFHPLNMRDLQDANFIKNDAHIERRIRGEISATA